MTGYVCDTHALIWHLSRDSRLSPAASAALSSADAGQIRIFVPTIVVVETIYLSEKARVPAAIVDRILHLLRIPDGAYAPVALDMAIADELRAISRETIPELPDRVIAATARRLKLPLITRDRAITQSGAIPVLW